MDRNMTVALLGLLAVTSGVLICLGVFLTGFTYYPPYENAEWENVKAKMGAEAARLEFEFGHCFENLSAGDLAGLSDNEIYSLVGNLMPLPTSGLLENENIYAVTVNQVDTRTFENENGRVVHATMQYSIWHKSRPDWELRGKVENENVTVLL